MNAKREELLARASALGWSQNFVARRIRRNPGHVSKVLLGVVTSARVWERFEAAIAREETRRRQQSA